MNVSVITTQTQMLTQKLEQATELALEAINNTLEQATQGKAETVHPRFIASFLLFSACALTCENGGTFNEGTCTCDCADGYSGATCGSECTVCCMNPCWLHRMS